MVADWSVFPELMPFGMGFCVEHMPIGMGSSPELVPFGTHCIYIGPTACGLIFDQRVSGRGRPLEETMFILLYTGAAIAFWKGESGF